MGKKKAKHGGKRPGAGRKPSANPRDRVFSLRVTAAEHDLLLRTEASKWGPGVLVTAAEKR